MVVSQVSLHRGPFTIAVLGAAVFATCTVLSSVAVQWVTDHVLLPRFEGGEVATSTLVAGVLFIGAVGVVRAGGIVVRRVFAGITQFAVGATLAGGVVDRLIRQPISWHQRRPDGDLVGRAAVDTDTAVAVLAPIPYSTGTVLMLFLSTVWLLVTDLVLGAVAVAMLPILLATNIAYQHRVDRHFDAAQTELGRLSANVHESFEGVQLVKAYGAEQRETERLAEIAGRVRDSRVEAIRLRGTFDAALDVLPALANVVIVVLGAVRVRGGDLTVGELTSFIYLFTLLVFPLRLVGYALSAMPFSLAGWTRVREVLDEPIEPDPVAALSTAPSGTGLLFDDVSFSFTGEPQPAVRDVSIAVPDGRIVAVVGPTGAGKSTMVELAGGLIAAGGGVVATGAGNRSLVFQEAFLFAGSIRDNVAMTGDYTDEQIWEALRLARADDFVADLPDRLDTVVGERGVSLSGGQRQRLALARALVRRPSLLLLDDTTSALDPATERAVLSNLRRSLVGTTVLMVASRPSTIALADDVIYVERGTVVDHGTHAELMARRPAYRRLVEAFEHDRAGIVVGVAGGGGQ
jgi:ATP-binding cassette, subfamily B, bacterial